MSRTNACTCGLGPCNGTCGAVRSQALNREDEPALRRALVYICDLCLDGAGGECHSPGCVLWINRAPDIAIRDHGCLRLLTPKEEDRIDTPDPSAAARAEGRREGLEEAAKTLEEAQGRVHVSSTAPAKCPGCCVARLADDIRAIAAALPAPSPAEAAPVSPRAGEETEVLRTAKDAAYAERQKCVAALVRAAQAHGLRAWLAQHDPADTSWESDWRTIVFVELPTGQVSWHLHDSEVSMFAHLPTGGPAWDGHDTAEKYRRLLAWRPDAGQREGR